MKNQYFGDERDLFKYDLIFYLLKESSKNSFTYIPMLTENDDTGAGGKRNYKKAVGAKNKKLLSFLEKHSDKKKEEKNFEKIGDFFKNEGIEASIYKPKDKYLSNKNRETYFANIPSGFLQNTLVFIDPDTGMEPKKAKEKHLKYDELNALLQKADESTVFMIFQFGERKGANLKGHSPPPLLFPKTFKAIQSHSDKLISLIGGRRRGVYSHIASIDVVFFFICKDVSYSRALAALLAKYKHQYPCKLETKEGEETYVIGNVLHSLGDNEMMKGPQKETLWVT